MIKMYGSIESVSKAVTELVNQIYLLEHYI